MSYVDAGYAISLGALFVYGLGLGLRRRRWERALKVVEVGDAAEPLAPGGRP